MNPAEFDGAAPADWSRRFEFQRLLAFGRHASACVHELNNLMTAILFRAEDALRRDDPLALRQALETCHHQAREVIELTRRVMLLNEASGEPPTACGLAEVLDEAVAAHPRSLAKDAIALSVHVPGELAVTAPRQLLRQLLYHLVHALRPGGGRGAGLRVEARREPHAITVEIDHLRSRASAAAARAHRTGRDAAPLLESPIELDLPVCDALARACGATFSAEPLHENGARYCVSWPAGGG